MGFLISCLCLCVFGWGRGCLFNCFVYTFCLYVLFGRVGGFWWVCFWQGFSRFYELNCVCDWNSAVRVVAKGLYDWFLCYLKTMVGVCFEGIVISDYRCRCGCFGHWRRFRCRLS